MLQRQHEYDQCLESFSEPLMRLLDYEEAQDGEVRVGNRLDYAYRYFDATGVCECLCRWVEITVREDFRAELEYVVRFRAVRRELEKLVEMPDRLANLFVKLCLENQGRLSATKRASHFAQFSDEEIAAMEAVVARNFKPTGGKVTESANDEPEQAG